MEIDLESETPLDTPLQACPICEDFIDITDLEPLSLISCPACGAEVKVRGEVDHFELKDVAGSGGMGVVYKALDTSLHRNVALKLLRKDHSDNADFIKQLETEAAITAAINHPHVVNVYSTGTDRGRFYIAMELVDKGSLDDLIRIQGTVSEAQSLEVGIHIAKGLRAAHEHGLIHRDVKPGNILFSDAHTAKIVDFGLAIFMSQEESVRGEIWGTPYYVAPEKLDNKPEDFRSDIYSLGATLFHALAGRPPFEAESASMVALKHLKSQPVSLQSFAPQVSSRTAYIINRTLLKDPALRYQSYDDLIEHFEYAREELLASAGRDRSQTRVVLETADGQKAWGYITAGMVAVMAIVGVSTYVFWDRLPGHKKPGIESAVVNDLPAGLAKAVADTLEILVSEEKPERAVEEYQKLILQNKLSQLDVKWALLQKAIAELDAGQLPAAQKTFKALGDRAAASRPTEEEKHLGTLFGDLNRGMSHNQPIDPARYQDMGRNSNQAVVLLIYGLKNWQLGKVDEAATLFRQFRFINPPSSCAWYANLKPLASRYVEQLTVFQMAADQMKAATDTGKKVDAAVEMLKVKGPLAERGKGLISADVIEELKKQGKLH